MEFKPFEYQNRGIEFLLDPEGEGRGLWMDMGLGKTVVTLTALDALFCSLHARKALIVAPVRVAQHTWPHEIKKWDHTRWLRTSVLIGTKRHRERAARSSAPIHLISYESLKWLIEFWGPKWPYDTVIFDEVSKMKSPGSQRFRAFRALLAAGRVERCFVLTGTPSDNGLVDVWAPTFLLDRGASLGRTATAFKNRWFTPHPEGYGWTPKATAGPQIAERVKHLYLSMLAEDYLDLPERVDNKIMVDLPTKAREVYEELERELFVLLDSGEEIESANAAVAKNKARQAANGAVYTDDLGSFSELHSAKLDALAEIVGEAQGSPILVGVAFRSDYARIEARFPQARRLDKDPETIYAWTRGEIPILLANPSSAGYGLNLQEGGAHILVQFGLTWSLGNYLQFLARLHRQGQKRPVINHLILARDTVDEYVLDTLANKKLVQDNLLKGVNTPDEATASDPGENVPVEAAVLTRLRARYGKAPAA
jgi:SNF2 family DNA or RNA helicase